MASSAAQNVHRVDRSISHLLRTAGAVSVASPPAHSPRDQVPPLYAAFENFMDHVVIQASTPPVMDPSDYIQSGQRATKGAPKRAGPATLGPVEQKLLTFLDDPTGGGKLAQLNGEVGCGKTTTLRYISTQYLQNADHSKALKLEPRLVIEVDFNVFVDNWVDPRRIKTRVEAQRMSPFEVSEDARSRGSITSWTDYLIGQIEDQVSRYWRQHLSPEAEFVEMWDWALDAKTDARQVPAAQVLGKRIDEILQSDQKTQDRVSGRRALKIAWRASSTAIDRLHYEALRLAYLVNKRFDGCSSGVCILLDNIDPLPASAHYELMTLMARLTPLGQCRTVLGTRPRTIRNMSPGMRGASVYSRIDHHGPTASDVIAHRIEKYVLNVEDADLERAVSICPGTEGGRHPTWAPLHTFGKTVLMVGSDKAIDLRVFRAWCAVLHERLLIPENGVAAPGSFREMLDNISAASIRFGKLLFGGFCESPIMPWMKILGIDAEHITLPVQGDQTSVLCYRLSTDGSLVDHESKHTHRWNSSLLRGVKAAAIEGHYNDHVCNLYASGDAEKGGPLLRIRMLQFLELYQRRQLQATVALLWQWLAGFGYDSRIVARCLNDMKSERKRLVEVDVWGDIFEDYPLISCDWAVAINPGGAYYLETLASNVDYFLGCMPSSDLASTVANISDSDVPGRMRIVRMGLTALVAAEDRDITMCRFNGAKAEYRDIMGNRLISNELLGRLSSTAQAILTARIEAIQQDTTTPLAQHHDALTRVVDELEAWQNFLPRTLGLQLSQIHQLLK